MAAGYPNVESIRWIVGVDEQGATVVLDDGSRWRVIPTHREQSTAWAKTLKVKVRGIESRLYELEPESGPAVHAAFHGFQTYEETAASGGE